MKKLAPRIGVIIVCLALLIYIAVYTQPPKSWEQASTFQILAVFLPILVLGAVVADFFFNYLPRSFLVGLGVMVIAVLQALKQLTPLIALGIILSAVLAARLFPRLKPKEIKDIPKLGLSKKAKESKLTKFRRLKR